MDGSCLIFYHYKEIKNYQFSQTNLSNFIRHGLNSQNWKKLSFDVLFLINGHSGGQCEILIPLIDNYLTYNTHSKYDFEVYEEGFRYLETIYQLNDISEKYKYIFFLNSEVSGPFLNPSPNDHWLLKFYNKLKTENSILCSTIITSLPETDLGGPGIRANTYAFLLDTSVLNFLRTEKIQNLHESSKADLHIKRKNTIFGSKYDHLDNILTGDYGLSRLLIQKGYRISCLIYNQNDLSQPLNGNIHQDRYQSFAGKNLNPQEVIFFKVNWIHNKMRICLPVENKKCEDLFNNYFPINKIKFDIDYNNLNLNPEDVGCTVKWENKEQYYNLYGEAEEIITFPKKNLGNKAVALYHHYDKDNIIKDYILQGLKTLMLSGYDIIFCTSCIIKNIDLPFEYIYLPNRGPGTDFISIYEILKRNLIEFKIKYDYLLFINDSIIFPINGVEHFKKTVNKMRQKCDFWGHWDSMNTAYHYIGTMIEIKNKLYDFFMKFLEEKIGGYKTAIRDKKYYILKVEILLYKFFTDLGFKGAPIVDMNKYGYEGGCPFYPSNIYKWLKDPDCIAIKWKYNSNYISLKYFNNPYLNYLVRYLHFGPNGPLGACQEILKIDPKSIVDKFENGTRK